LRLLTLVAGALIVISTISACAPPEDAAAPAANSGSHADSLADLLGDRSHRVFAVTFLDETEIAASLTLDRTASGTAVTVYTNVFDPVSEKFTAPWPLPASSPLVLSNWLSWTNSSRLVIWPGKAGKVHFQWDVWGLPHDPAAGFSNQKHKAFIHEIFDLPAVE
jgi:hypothetical protein